MEMLEQLSNLKDILLKHFPDAKISYEKRDKLMQGYFEY